VRRLNGESIALLEARMSSELENLVRRYGGNPRSAPALREVPRDAPVELDAFLDRLCANRFQIAIFLTGVGVTTLLREASVRGRLDAAVDALRRTTTACRGSKPAAALRHYGVPTRVSAREPFTSAELLDALQATELADVDVALVHYGERNEALAEALRHRGARVEELCLYQWQLPENLEPLRELITDVIHGRVDAVAFTSKVQCRHLFQVAAAMGCAADLAEALTARTTVAAIGPVCRAALREHSVPCHVMPAAPKMAPLVAAIAEYLEFTHTKPEAN
jgi:uroporphyrinogen-III synthase